MPLRIAIGGFLHESHSFAPRSTGWAEFVQPGGLPPLRSGPAMLDAVRGTSVAVAGALAEAAAAGAMPVPLTWCFANPAGPVEDQAFERIAALICASLVAAMESGPLDGVYLYWMPITSQCTLVEPMQGVMAQRARIASRPGVIELAWCFGFPYADFPGCGPAFVAYADTAAAADEAADDFLACLQSREPDFRSEILSARDAVAAAIQEPCGPVLIADTQDNPGGGGHGDTTGLLAELIRQGARGAVVCLINDAESAGRCHDAGQGGTVRLSLGGKSDGMPLTMEATVLMLTDGQFTLTGPMGDGNPANLGPMALIEVEHAIRVVVARRVRPRLSSSASSPAIRIRVSAAPSPVRRWVKQSGNGVQRATSASRSVMCTRGSMAYRRAARASASGGVDFLIGTILSTPPLMVTSGSIPSLARASTAVSRSSSLALRPAMKASKSASTAIGRVPARWSSCSVSTEINRSSKERYCRLPVTQTSSACSRSRSSDKAQSS